jgi:N-acyl-D-amino-acid deacylase
MTGDAVPGMESFDQMISDLITRWQVPGAAIAVVKDGRLVYARGFGYADVYAGELVQPDSLFRIGSVSKPLTAITIMKLVQEGKLGLDDKAFDYLTDLAPPDGATVDPRLSQITIRNLLEHSGGWNSAVSFDPVLSPERVATGLGIPGPPSAPDIVRFMKGQPLDFDPGTQYAYSNFGYCVLGRIIEQVTGQSYEDYVRSEVLAPLGVTRMRIGHTRPEYRVTGEVKYYDYPGAPEVRSVFPSDTGLVPAPYGGVYFEAADSAGGWIASPIDYVRLMLAADGRPEPPDLLTPATIDEMIARPDIPVWKDATEWYAKGWTVQPVGDDGNWWHVGAAPGTGTIVVRAYNGLTWAAFYNSRPSDSESFIADMKDTMWNAAAGVTSWPSNDQFSRYVPYQGPPTIPPTVEVTSPNGGEKLVAGTTVDITWNASDDHAVYQFDVALSTDGGRTYPIAIATGLDGAERHVEFAIPRTLKSKRARIRVIARDADGNATADTSDRHFKIKKPK